MVLPPGTHCLMAIVLGLGKKVSLFLDYPVEAPLGVHEPRSFYPVSGWLIHL